MSPQSSARSASSCSSARRAASCRRPAGLRYYKSCVEAVGRLETCQRGGPRLAGVVTGDLRVGLMPTFTRAVLAPTLEDFVPRHPDVRLHVFEGYSGVLTDMVLADELDFAVVPAFEGRIGLEIAPAGARPRDAALRPTARAYAARTGAARRLRAAEDRRARAAQCPPSQPRDLFPYPWRRGRRHAGNGRYDRHARIRRALGLGDRAAEPHLRQRHRQGRSRGQSDHRAAAARRIHRHPAGATHLESCRRGCSSTASKRKWPISAPCGTAHWPRLSRQMAAADETLRPGINANRPTVSCVPDAMERELKRAGPIQSARVLPGIGLKSRRLDAGDRAGLVACPTCRRKCRPLR